MIYCSINELYSVNDLKSAAEYMSQYEQDIKVDKPEIQLLNNKGIINLNTQKRKITEYEFLGDDDNE